jgi:cupin superfamily acireductone dioxygenase involved in methionine salvage
MMAASVFSRQEAAMLLTRSEIELDWVEVIITAEDSPLLSFAQALLTKRYPFHHLESTEVVEIIQGRCSYEERKEDGSIVLTELKLGDIVTIEPGTVFAWNPLYEPMRRDKWVEMRIYNSPAFKKEEMSMDEEI